MITEKEATALVRRWKKSTKGGIYLGRGNFGQAVLFEGAVLKLPVERDIHGRSWRKNEIQAAFRQEAAAAMGLRSLGFDVVPATVLVENEEGPILVREYGEPVESLTVAEWDRLSQRLGDVQDAGWSISDQLFLLRRPNGSIFVGDVGLWRPSTDAKNRFSDNLPHLLDFVRPRSLPRTVPSWYEIATRAQNAQNRWVEWEEELAQEKEELEVRDVILPLFNLRVVFDGAMERKKRKLPIPAEALAILARGHAMAKHFKLPWPLRTLRYPKG
jgi:hypothetical protein